MQIQIRSINTVHKIKNRNKVAVYCDVEETLLYWYDLWIISEKCLTKWLNRIVTLDITQPIKGTLTHSISKYWHTFSKQWLFRSYSWKRGKQFLVGLGVRFLSEHFSLWWSHDILLLWKHKTTHIQQNSGPKTKIPLCLMKTDTHRSEEKLAELLQSGCVSPSMNTVCFSVASLHSGSLYRSYTVLPSSWLQAAPPFTF